MTEQIVRGGSNVLADLGRPDSSERQTKIRLAMAVNQILAERGLKQAEAAKLLGVPRPRISALAHYKLNEFSVEKLMSFLTALDRDVEIMIRPSAHGVGAVSVLLSARS